MDYVEYHPPRRRLLLHTDLANNPSYVAGKLLDRYQFGV